MPGMADCGGLGGIAGGGTIRQIQPGINIPAYGLSGSISDANSCAAGLGAAVDAGCAR